jgi:hypothetical protein
MFPSTKNTTPFWYPPKPNSEGILSHPFGSYPKPQIFDLVVLAAYPFGSILSSVSKGVYRYGSVLIDIGTSQNNGNSLSNAEKKGGYIFLNSGNVTNDINHEFGHILGLSDRYSETVSYNSSFSGGGRRRIINNLPVGGRDGTIPLEIKSDKEHNSQTNLMSNPQGGTGTITSQQSNIIFNNKSEKQYFRPVILRDASPSNSSIQDNLYNSVRAQNIFGIFSKVTPYRNGAKINIVSENPVTWFNNRAGFISSHGMYKRQYNSWPSGDNRANNISNIRRALNAP